MSNNLIALQNKFLGQGQTVYDKLSQVHEVQGYISDDDIADLNLPTGTPIVYELGDDLRPVETKPVLERSLDPEAARAAAEAVARQAG